MRLHTRVFLIGVSVAAVAASWGAAVPVVAPPLTPPPQPTPVPVPVFVPESIDIPSIELADAPIVPVGTEPDGAMGTPGNARDVAWWAGIRAGEGNALFAAHRDWKKEKGSFYSLSDLAEGDEVIVRGQGEELKFRIIWVEQVDADIDATEMLGDQGEPVVTLITCGGPFDRSIRHYEDRIVARGVLAT